MGHPRAQLSGCWARVGPQGLSWGCQGSGYPSYCSPSLWGPGIPHRCSAGAFTSPLVSLPLGMPQGSDPFLLLLQESLAVPAQQPLQGRGNLQGGLDKLVLQSPVNSCSGASWPQRCVQRRALHCRLSQGSGAAAAARAGAAWGQLWRGLLAPHIQVEKLGNTTLVSF